MPDPKGRVLAVDDDEGFLQDLTALLAGRYEIERTSTAAAALEAVRRGGLDAVLLDLDLGRGDDGLELVERIREIEPALPVIIVTADASSASAVAALKRGAADYVDKTPELGELERRISRAVAEQKERLAAENRFLRREIDALKGEMIGDSPPMRALHEAIARAAQSPRPVLLVGETGTGKELVARALHRLACPRGLFVALNCAAVPGDLFESELFGSERGAYTGAERRATGAFEMAAGGLVYLDEITEIDSSTQAALLRVIEQREFRPLGGSKPLRFTGRVVASTNRDLKRALSEGRLRQDLFYRLSANVLSVPPLRSRREDIPKLVEHFLERAAAELKRPRPEIGSQSMVRLCSHDWPGNVRELEYCIESFVLGGALAIGVAAGPPRAPDSPEVPGDDLLGLSYHEAKALAVRRFQKRYVDAVLAAHGGSVAAAAEKMGLSRFGLEKVLRQLAETEPPAAV